VRKHKKPQLPNINARGGDAFGGPGLVVDNGSNANVNGSTITGGAATGGAATVNL
jgi:hypothetical protein